MESAGHRDFSSFEEMTLLQPLKSRFVWHTAPLQYSVDHTVSPQHGAKQQHSWRAQEITISTVLGKDFAPAAGIAVRLAHNSTAVLCGSYSVTTARRSIIAGKRRRSRSPQYWEKTLLQPLELRFVWHTAPLQYSADHTVSPQHGAKQQQRWRAQDIEIPPVSRK